MPSPWQERRLADVFTVMRRGITPKYTEDNAVGIPVINQRCIREGRVTLDPARLSLPVKAIGKDRLLQAGDILVNSTGTGTLGRTAQWTFRNLRATADSHVTICRPSEAVDARFLAYAIRNLEPAIEGLALGSTGQTELNVGLLRGLSIPVPPIEEQRKISETLSSLDDLVTTNRCLIQDLREMARTVVQTADGECILDDVAAWGGLPVSKPAGLVDHYSLPSFDADEMPERVLGEKIRSSKQMLDSACVLVSRLNPHIPRVWMTYPNGKIQGVASTEFVPLFGKGVSTELIYALCSSETYLTSISGFVTGTTSSHQRVEKSALVRVEVKDPRTLDPNVQASITKLVRAAESLRAEIQELEATRDALLPLLLSGRVRAGDVAA